ncbi:MAG: spermidine synthase [Candidatus Omnitrophota bacterium]|nr:spermidine synthase [Candidatus Omnitrophota bacterium]
MTTLRSFEELDYRKTRLGELSLRRRMDPVAGVEVFEVKLGEAYLMSSLFTVAETELARLGLAGLDAAELDVLVGGLGLGYTARAALEHPKLRSLVVVEALPEVIDWHKRGLVPAGAELAADKRCRFVADDFFTQMKSAGERYHAILLDIDHSPRNLLHPAHGAFYQPEGLRHLTGRLHPGGVFALWSNDPPDEAFEKALKEVFETVKAHIVKFHNPYQNRDSSSTVYVAR